ncbi:gamma subclass chorismate mutase AroQ [Streptomyces sp. CA-106110]|uniref:gamma subclass chorismate mutase AroQ n=1 Tax=Streptomyces sp. CA-106110 TaxID=3240044 RepID=UPI003D8F297C
MKSQKTLRRPLALSAAAVAATAFAGPRAVAATPAPPAQTQGSPVHLKKPLGRLGSLTNLIVQRLLVSDLVAAAKFGTGTPINDPAREQQALGEVRQQAITLGLDPDETVAFFQGQITASKIVQEGLFAEWTAHPNEAPTARPDLSKIRAQLDQLTTELLQELKATLFVRGTLIGCAEELTLSKQWITALDHVDLLHRQALAAAMQSVCTGPSKRRKRS